MSGQEEIPVVESSSSTLAESESLKRKRNRWGSPQGGDETPVCVVIDQKPQGTEESSGQVRRSRFSAAPAEPVTMALPAMPVQLSQEIIQQTLVLQLQLQRVNEKLITVVRDALEISARPDRSPSPPPRYDASGKRTNNREVRMREALMKEKGRLIEELLKVNPTYQAPADFVKSKPLKRIYLPKQTNPLYNYIGLIIGPRGNTQKQMEADTGCKISIRGKGSAKEGSKSKAKNADDDDELHVHITGEDDASVEKAAKIIEELLKPQDDSVNEHKQKQLRELALINGTLREDEYCPVCGEKGHRQFECPHRARSFKAAGVKCSICGDLSHPTRDCPLKQAGPTDQVTLDTEYDSFMAELTDGPSKGPKTASDASSSSSAASSKAAGKAGGPIYVAPIVDLVAPRKNQTIIHVTTVMTGLVPPVFSSSSAAMPTDGSATITAPTSTAYPSYPGYPPAQPAATTPTAATLAAYSMASAAAPWQGGYSAPGAYGAAPAYGAYPPAYGQNPYPSAPYGAPMYGAVPPPGSAPAAPAVPPPPPASSVPLPPAAGNQFHYVYPTSK